MLDPREAKARKTASTPVRPYHAEREDAAQQDRSDLCCTDVSQKEKDVNGGNAPESTVVEF